MGKEERFGNKINTAGFSQNKQNINKKGRPLSFRGEYKKILGKDGMIWVDAKDVKKRTKAGKKQIGIQLTKREIIIAKLDRLIMSSKDAVSLNAIKFIFQHLDEPHKQKVDLNNNVTNVTDMKLLSMDEFLEFQKNNPDRVTDGEEKVEED